MGVGVQTEIRRRAPKAVYIHCAGHSLKLLISSCCGLPEIQNMISKVKEVCMFFNYSPKRNGFLSTQSPEEMCLSLEHQNPSKISEIMGYFDRVDDRVTVRYTFCIPQTKCLRARKIGLQYKIRKGRKQIWGRFSNP